MKIFANKEIKKLFLAVSVIWVAFLLLTQGFLWLCYQRFSLFLLFVFVLPGGAILAVGCSYFKKQNQVMEQAVSQINAYLDGDHNARIECDDEGELYRLFHTVNSLAAVLNAHADNELREKEFLKNTAYPLTKGAAEFFADWLIDDGKGRLVTPVGVSPENWFITPGGERTALSMGPTMDMAIIRETFERTIQMSEMFNLDTDFRKELEDKLAKLLPYQIGSRGQLQEWMYDFKEQDPQHRHLSHLYGFYPGDQITPDKTPELFKAVEQTLNLRGDAATGWSMGWKINCWARLLDGNHAYEIIRNLFNPVQFGPKKRNGGGLYSNLLDACPPFQIDGNFGYAAGVAEMLMQSHAGFIQLLPALPDVWSEGNVSGLKARGNFEIAMQWKQGSLSEATILSVKGNECRLRTAVPVTIKQGSKEIASSSPVTSNGKEYYEAVFATTAGTSYRVNPVTP